MSPAAQAPDGKGGPHAFVDDVGRPHLSDADRHHLARVVRLRVGDALTVGDGRGSWRACRFGDELELDGPVVAVPQPEPALTIAFALVKGSKPELVVQKLTELGIDVIRPFVAARSVVRWDDAKAASATERLRRIAREASMQCRRAWLPEVVAPVGFASVAALSGVVLADRDGEPISARHTVVAIGPEGGWAPDELDRDLPRVVLGRHVLRAETAAIAAGTLLAASRDQQLRDHDRGIETGPI